MADGDIGLAVAEVEGTDSVITMYLSMLKLKGGWKIVSRVSRRRFR